MYDFAKIQVRKVIITICHCRFPRHQTIYWSSHSYHKARRQSLFNLQTIRKNRNVNILIHSEYTIIVPFHYLKATWHEAGEICSSHSRKLATFKIEEDYDTLALQLYALSNQNSSQDEFKINRRYWIGLNDIEKPGLWRWNRDIQPALVNKWSKGEKPNHNSSNNSSSDCVIMWNPLRNLHLWKDEPCSNKYYFICEDCETCF